MTLGEGKRRVLMLLDEYSTGGTVTVDDDLNLRMNDFFDMAQRDVAAWQPIVRRTTVQMDGTGSVPLPRDVQRVLRIRRENGRGGLVRAADCGAVDGRLTAPEGDRSLIVLDYIAAPAAIGPDTADSYVFEVGEEAANCLPFFVAAQQLIADLVVDYGAFYNLYLQMRAMLTRTGNTPDGGVRQALYRG